MKDTKYTDLREEFTPIALLRRVAGDEPNPFLQIVVRSRGAARDDHRATSRAAVGAGHRRHRRQYDTIQQHVRDSLLRERLMATLSGFFGGLATLIATIGLYGVMSYMVARRRNEIGIRMALGADRGDVVTMVMREAAAAARRRGRGRARAGVIAARTATTLLFGLQPGDPATLALAVAGLGAVAMLASYLPALRASRLEPTDALRED